jgi:hypothetical protein
VYNEPSLTKFVKENAANTKANQELKLRRADIKVQNPVLHEVYLFDVRTCSPKIPSQESDVGSTVQKGEDEKVQFYGNNFVFPESTVLIPFAIDSYGKWGNRFKHFLKHFCKLAAGEDEKMYNQLIKNARETIQVAHANAIGKRIFTNMAASRGEAYDEA